MLASNFHNQKTNLLQPDLILKTWAYEAARYIKATEPTIKIPLKINPASHLYLFIIKLNWLKNENTYATQSSL